MVSKNANPYPNCRVTKLVKKGLSIVRIIGIVILGGSSGMIANRFVTQENQDYNERATYVERQQLEKEAKSKSEYLKKTNKKEHAKQKIEVFPVVTASTIASAYNENTAAADLKMFKASGSVSNIIASFIGYPYITLHGGVDKLMGPQFSNFSLTFVKSSQNQP